MKRFLLMMALTAAVAACSDDDDNGGTDVANDTGDTSMGDTGDTGMDDTGTDGGADVDEDVLVDVLTDPTDVPLDVVPDIDVIVPDTGDADAGPMPRGADNPPTPGTQIDRVGRPAISTATVGTFLPDDDANPLKDAYNAAADDTWAIYSADIATSLGILDALDATCGNQLLADDDNEDGRYNTLAEVLADDQLYVHSERGACGVYLGLEAEVVGAIGAGEGGCGGRMLSDDIIDRSYSVLAAGLLTGIDDTVTENDVAFLDEFPYLAAPQEAP